MAGQASILDDAGIRARILFSGEGRNPGRCASSAAALPWAPAFAGEPRSGEVDR
jgi:hypothetical protein